MARQRRSPSRGNQFSSGRNRSQSSDFHQERSQTIGTARKYARAVLSGDESMLDEMTLYQQSKGAVGGGSSNVTNLRNAGATHIKEATSMGRQAVVMFGGSNNDIACIGVFNTLPGGHVLSDWEIYTKK